MSGTERPTAERREIHYEGDVQGVGFRFTTLQAARRYEVTGLVRNLPDGRVQVLAEGPPDQLDKLAADIAGAMSGYIRRATVATSRATGEFSGFEVAF